MTRLLDPTALVRPLAKARMRRLWAKDAVEAQRRTLLQLVAKAKATRFGQDHGFASITSVEAYQQAVPLRAYDDFWQSYWKAAFPVLEDVSWPGRIPYFCKTSGTTSGKTKHIPLTRETLRQNQRAALDMVAAHLTHHPKSRFFGGRSFVLGGSAALEELAPGVWSGDLSGIVAKTQRPWMLPFTFPPVELALEADWDKKLERMVQALPGQTITCLSGVPSWVLILFDRLDEVYDRWPLTELELYVHGGVPFDPYKKRFAGYLERSGATTREVYPASEAFLAFADRGDGEGLLLSFDTGIFYEFVPMTEFGSENASRHWLANIEPDIDYAVVLTGPSGIWSYVLGDTVQFTETKPPRLLVTGRTAYQLSAFGEHLIASELDDAIIGAVEQAGASLSEYVIGPVLPEGKGAVGHHMVFIEPANGEALDAQELARAIDRRLHELNDDYVTHREGDVGMGPPEVVLLPPGATAEWMREEGRLGGQNKVPRVIADAERFAKARQGLQ
ncbi:MAG: auxin-regulated protein, partial [Geminicoccaceae bacterium]